MQSNQLYPMLDTIVTQCQEYFVGDFDTTLDETKCDTLEKITSYYKRTGRIIVWTGASEDTIFGTADVNYRFRAWHDWVHVINKLAFNREGELAVNTIQKSHIFLLWCRGRITCWELVGMMCNILDTEITKQLEYKDTHGVFPTNQRKFSIKENRHFNHKYLLN